MWNHRDTTFGAPLRLQNCLGCRRRALRAEIRAHAPLSRRGHLAAKNKTLGPTVQQVLSVGLAHSTAADRNRRTQRPISGKPSGSHDGPLLAGPGQSDLTPYRPGQCGDPHLLGWGPRANRHLVPVARPTRAGFGEDARLRLDRCLIVQRSRSQHQRVGTHRLTWHAAAADPASTSSYSW